MNAGWLLLAAVIGLALGAWAIGKITPTRTTAKLANDELGDIEREEFTLMKNMRHDRHRLAYLKARRRELKALPGMQPVLKRSNVVSVGLFDRLSRRDPPDSAPVMLEHESRQ